ncbi:MAG TPA: hypothetical protein VFH61_13490 [Thermoleophilia bacterium]|nr:hypothetical protein [Thermoleophilia bacterium]
MSLSLPSNPSLTQLRHQAKDILKAQRTGDASGCRPLRKLRRFSDAADEEILGARVTLHEAQLALALEYGFASWDRLRRHVQAEQARGVSTLEAVVSRSVEEIPEYAGAGVPLGVVAALNHAGVDIDFMQFAAASGWAFSFGYTYGDISPAFMAVRGNPNADGPLEVFAFLPTRLGFDYEMAETKKPEQLWPFVRKHLDTGTPIVSEHLDGGLISGTREHNGTRQVYFDGTVGAGWIDVDKLHPYAVYVLVRAREAEPPEQIARDALRRALRKASAHEHGGVPQGMAALRGYLADVSDPSKDFAECGEWFCWAAFERLMARKCCSVWLRSLKGFVPDECVPLLDKAAGLYAKAFELYEQYRAEVLGGEPTPLSLEERARTPERIGVIAPLLEQAISAEAAGIEALRNAVAALD